MLRSNQYQTQMANQIYCVAGGSRDDLIRRVAEPLPRESILPCDQVASRRHRAKIPQRPMIFIAATVISGTNGIIEAG